jgi:hypothetical protein
MIGIGKSVDRIFLNYFQNSTIKISDTVLIKYSIFISLFS